MAGDVSLGDLLWVVGGVVSLTIFMCLRAQIGAFGRAFWVRHFNRNWWDDLLIWLADQGGSVNDYEDRGAGTAVGGYGIEPLVPGPVPPRQDAASTGTIIPVPEDLSRQELLDILARQRIDNKYVFSGNKLAELLASTPHAASRNVILEEIARVRKGDEPEPPKRPSARLERPVNGWH